MKEQTSRKLNLFIYGCIGVVIGFTPGFICGVTEATNDYMEDMGKLKTQVKKLKKYKAWNTAYKNQRKLDYSKLVKELKHIKAFCRKGNRTVSSITWLREMTDMLEKQGMVGCTYKKGKLCKPKFNVTHCSKEIAYNGTISEGYYYICPTDEPYKKVMK